MEKVWMQRLGQGWQKHHSALKGDLPWQAAIRARAEAVGSARQQLTLGSFCRDREEQTQEMLMREV